MIAILSYLLFLSTVTSEQCRIEDYLLRAFKNDKAFIAKTYSDSTITTFYSYSNKANTIFGDQKIDKIDAYSFKLKNHPCVKNNEENYCSIYYRRNKLYFVELILYYDKKDSTKCKATFEKIIKESSIETEFPYLIPGTSETLTEYSNYKELDLKKALATPNFQFFKNINKKESIRVGYTLSNTTNEYELSVQYLNKDLIEK